LFGTLDALGGLYGFLGRILIGGSTGAIGYIIMT